MSRVGPTAITAPVISNDRWIMKVVAWGSVVVILGTLLIWVGMLLFTHDTPSRSASHAATTTATSPTVHCNTGATTYSLSREAVVVNRQGLCSSTIWYPPEGCADMRRARSSVFEGPYGHCPGSKGIWGPNDMEAMRSSSDRVVKVDVALGPPRYN